MIPGPLPPCVSPISDRARAMRSVQRLVNAEVHLRQRGGRGWRLVERCNDVRRRRHEPELPPLAIIAVLFFRLTFHCLGQRITILPS